MDLIHELLDATANVRPDALSITDRSRSLSYAQMAQMVHAIASGLIECGLRRGDRVAVWLPKCNEKAIALFGAMRAAGIAVPINAHLKPPQVAHILGDSGARILVTTHARLADLQSTVPNLANVETVVTIGEPIQERQPTRTSVNWRQLLACGLRTTPRQIDVDIAIIFYTSGSTGRAKGVVLTHRNLVLGARSVSDYLGNTASDQILGVLSLGFDYGFSQLTTAFSVGARVVLLDFLTPQEVVLTIERQQITGMAAVPPIWIQVAKIIQPDSRLNTLRYITNSGGTLPPPTISTLRRALPHTRIFLMYGLTEAFRSTYLPPDDLDRRPDSIGRAIPGAEVMVLRQDGSPCNVGEPGELVHRGGLVSLGYWNDPERTSERFRPIPSDTPGRPTPDIGVWSGDIVRSDPDGYLYFIGRSDDMIKTSGFRVSPTEIEDEAYATGLVQDAVAIGIPHASLGQSILLLVKSVTASPAETDELLSRMGRRLPRFMLPTVVEWLPYIPLNNNGKYDRAALRREYLQRLQQGGTAEETNDGGVAPHHSSPSP